MRKKAASSRVGQVLDQHHLRAAFEQAAGHAEKGCIVPEEVSEFLLDEAASVADILCPNQLELDSFCGRRPSPWTIA